MRVEVAQLAAFPRRDRRWWRCRPALEPGGCEQRAVDGGRLLYRWSPGVEEEEPGTYAWTVVRQDEVVRVSYEGSGLFASDPRRLGLGVDPGDLRAAALDPALGLRTTPATLEVGAALASYDGEEEPPEEPVVTRTTPRQLADRVADYLGRRPRSVTRSPLTDFGADAVGARLRFGGTARYDPFTVDVLTTVGRVPQLDPMPCRVQRSSTAVRDRCFAWDRDTAATWTLADGDRPGVLWIVGAQDDDVFNRVESVGVRVVSSGLTQHYFADPGLPWRARIPVELLGDLYGLTGDLSVGPEQRRTDP